jgi:hypothetical protein
METEQLKMITLLEELEVDYELHREPGSLEWEDLKPRVEKRLRYLLRPIKE